ncbi:MAG: hypothetical protein HQ495_15930 [Alphaproteobacteria bacterium]|nr:hypothetical protein [Alphaproteobacteria bacterium]
MKLLILVAAAALCANVVLAAPLPLADCGASTTGESAGEGTPAVGIWFGRDLATWEPAPCTGWTARPFTVLVETTGVTKFSGTKEDILDRLGRISDLATIQYWSTTRGRWRSLIPDATALSSDDPDDRRVTDFTAQELVTGAHFFWQKENTPLGDVTYRLSVRQADATTVIVDMVNARTARATIFSKLPPGHHEFLYVFRRGDDGMWRIYGLMRTGNGPNPIAATGRKSYGNRAVALFRYLAGDATDGAPPLFP